jgi:hypothetical protein
VDEKLSQALERSNFMTTFATQRRLLWEKYQDDLIHYKDGHELPITETLISFCNTLLQKGKTRTVIIDANNLPVQIDNLDEFLTNILEQYASSSNEYFAEFEKLKKTRHVEGLVNL